MGVAGHVVSWTPAFARVTMKARPCGRDDGQGGLHNRRARRASRGMIFATEDTEGTEGSWPQVGSVVSVILCGLSCPCGPFILSVVVHRVAPSSSFRVRRRRIEESVLQRRAATPLMLLWHGVGCLVEALFKRVPPLRAFGPPVGMTAKGGL